MKNNIKSSCVSFPVPTELYVSMRDLLSNSNMECGPALMVPSILQESRTVAGANQPKQNRGGRNSARC